MTSRCQLLSGRLPLRPRALPITQHATRTFTTSSPLHKAPKGGDLGFHMPASVIPKGVEIPPYPYGDAALFKQSNKGLYGGQTIHFGNNVSKRTETKSRRTWTPNVLNKALYSVALKKRIKLRITSKVLKVMDREGGLDEYLLKESEARIKELGPLGWALRWRLMQTPSVVARFRAEAAALGLAQSVIDQQWPEAREGFKQAIRGAEAREREVARAKEEEAAAIQANRERISEEKAFTRKRIFHHKNEILRKGVRQDPVSAEKLAVPMAKEDERLLALFDGRYATLLAYRKALRAFVLDKKGKPTRRRVVTKDKESTLAWLAKYNAKRQFQTEQEQKAEEEAAKAREEAEREREMVTRGEQEKDWVELTPEPPKVEKAKMTL